MASYICLIALCCLVAVTQTHVVKTTQVKLPPQGMTIEISIKPNGEEDVKTGGIPKKTDVAQVKKVKIPKQVATHLPSVETRRGIVVGNCPAGYVSRGGFCFPDYD